MSLISVIPRPVRRALRPMRELLFPQMPVPPAVLEPAIVEVLPPPDPVLPPAVVGYVRERSIRHVAGFIHYPEELARRVEFEVVCTLPGAERVLAEGVAELFDRTLFALHVGDAVYGFRVNYPEPISEAERDHIEVRPIATGRAIQHDPELQTEWKPIRFIAMDIVDNCNLRCPFCIFDHAPVHKTNVMTDETFASALRMLPFVSREGHWMSCRHEPSMHPRLTEFIQRIPREHRHLMHYTTNLAKRMPDAYFETLAESGLSNLNVSIESRDPTIYERMRKGAKHRIFMENWEKLLDAFSRGSAPPPLRYIAMAYKSNFRELPSLIEYLRNERRAWKIEIRDTIEVPWIPQEFRDAEYMDHSEWVWLHAALAKYSPDEVALVLPENFSPDTPPVATEADRAAADRTTTPPPPAAVVENPLQAAMDADIPGMIEARILHDGTLYVYASPAGYYHLQPRVLAELNIRDVEDVSAFVMSFVQQTTV